MTFEQAFEKTFELRKKRLSNGKHVNQWSSTMKAYAFPVLGTKPVSSIDGEDILSVLLPLWTSKPETARRLLQRIRTVFETAIILKWRTLADPTIGIRQLLGDQNQVVKHHKSMPFTAVPRFMSNLRDQTQTAPIIRMALAWLVLTTTRSGDTRGADWSEIDLAASTWTIPPNRLKGRKKPHAVPLSAQCLAILKQLPARTVGLIFPSPTDHQRPISENTFVALLNSNGYDFTAHGFRSSFRTWAEKVAKADDKIAEACLAHKIGNRVVRAYLRDDFLDERRPLMQQWADFCDCAPLGSHDPDL